MTRAKPGASAITRVLHSELAHSIFFQLAFSSSPLRLVELAKGVNKSKQNTNEYLGYLLDVGFVKRKKMSGVHVEYSVDWKGVMMAYEEHAVHYAQGAREEEEKRLIKKICSNPEFKKIFERFFVEPPFGPGRHKEPLWGNFRDYFLAWKFRIIMPLYLHYKDAKGRPKRPNALGLYEDLLKLGEIYSLRGDLGKGVHDLLFKD